MLSLENVGYHYAGRPWVFRNVTFAVPAGSATAVLGPNGSGKTTLVRCAAGLLTLREGVVRREQSIGYVPQAHGSTFSYRTVDMVLMGRARHVRLFASPDAADVAAAWRALERVGIADLGERLFPTLSGGEQQLVLIARALAAESPVMILDEPSTGLDMKNQVRVLNLLRDLADEGLALLVTTHHPDHALYLADSVVLMGHDSVTVGLAGDLLTSDALTALYGVDVRTLEYSDPDDSVARTAIVTRYERQERAN